MNESPPDFRRLAGVLVCKIDQAPPPDSASVNEVVAEAVNRYRDANGSVPMPVIYCNMIAEAGIPSYDQASSEMKARFKCVITAMKNRLNCTPNEIRITLQRVLEDRAGELSQGHSAT